MKDSLEFLIPVIISIIAIVFTGMQQNIANKQFLFDKRLSIYQLYNILLEHQKVAELHFKGASVDDFCLDSMLISDLTNDSILESGIVGWNDRNGDSIMKPENQKSFLEMLEKLRSYGAESSFIFSGKDGQNLCKYFDKYADLCQKTYKYSIFMADDNNENEQLNKINKARSLEETIKKQRPLHMELNQIYTELCKLSESIKLSDLEKSISFIKRISYENNKKLGHKS